jgi:hypothetical protein
MHPTARHLVLLPMYPQVKVMTNNPEIMLALFSDITTVYCISAPVHIVRCSVLALFSSNF